MPLHQRRHDERPTPQRIFWRWLYLASPGGQLSSHPAAGLLCIIGLVCGLVGFVRWASGFSGWETFLGIAAILCANALIGAAIRVFLEQREARPNSTGDAGGTRWGDRIAVAEEAPDDLLQSTGIDMPVPTTRKTNRSEALGRAHPLTTGCMNYLHAAIVVAICGAIGWLFRSWALAEANTAMVFLAGFAYVAARLGRGPAIAASVAGVLVFDFCLVPPYFTFAVSDARYVVTFAVMLAIGLVISELNARLRDRLQASRLRERQTATLYGLTKQLSKSVDAETLSSTAGQRLAELFTAEVAIYLRELDGRLTLRSGKATSIVRAPVNAAVAQWVADNGRVAGAGTDTLPGATALFVPLIGAQRTLGVIGVRPADAERFLDREQRRLLETCASLIALATERNRSMLDAHEAPGS